MTVDSFFTPLNELILDDDDLDMGSGGNLLLPDQPGPNPHLMIGVGKVGTIYLVNRDSMGGFNASMDQMVQELPGAIGGMFSTPAYWQGKVAKVGLRNMIYTVASNDQPKRFVITNGMIETAPESIARTSHLDSRARRRSSRPITPPAASCGPSTLRAWQQAGPRFSMPSTRPT